MGLWNHLFVIYSKTMKTIKIFLSKDFLNVLMIRNAVQDEHDSYLHYCFSTFFISRFIVG